MNNIASPLTSKFNTNFVPWKVNKHLFIHLYACSVHIYSGTILQQNSVVIKKVLCSLFLQTDICIKKNPQEIRILKFKPELYFENEFYH